MSTNDFDATVHEPDDHDHDHEGHDHEIEAEEALEEALELDTQSQIFLEMRRQNLELLRLASEVVGYTGSRTPTFKPHEVKDVMEQIWNVFSEFYEWIDPEEAENDEEDEDEDE